MAHKYSALGEHPRPRWLSPPVLVPLTLWVAAAGIFVFAQHISPPNGRPARAPDAVRPVAITPPRLAESTPSPSRAEAETRAPAAAKAAVSSSLLDTTGDDSPAVASCASRFCSVGKLKPYRAGDLEQKGELEKAVAARSWEGELVLSYANAGGSAWVTNLALSLRDVGIEHFLLLMMTDGACAQLHDSAARLSCGWSSWDMEGCKSERDQMGATERMWFIRHHYLARLIGLGTVNVMALDGDVTVNAMPYPLLHEPDRLGDVHFVISLDNAPTALNVNNGFVYLRGCTPGGQSQRVLLEILQRERDVCRNGSVFFSQGRGPSGAPYWDETDRLGITRAEGDGGRHVRHFISAKDQKVYQDVLASAFCARHMALRYEPSSAKIVKGRWADYVRHFTGGLSLEQLLQCIAFEPHKLRPFQDGDPDLFPAKWPEDRFSHWTKPLRLPRRPQPAAGGTAGGAGGIVGYDLRGPVEAAGGEGERSELIGAPNTSFIASWHGTTEGEIPGWSGLWAKAPPVVAHFVGGLDKVGAMLALGWWRWHTETVVANLPRAAGAPPPALGAVDAPMQRHFQKGLPRVLALAGPGAAAWHADFAVSVRAQAARRLWLAAVASTLGRVAVEPVTDCTQPWLVRLNNSAFGWSRRNQRVPRFGIFQEVDERSRVGATLGECRAGFSPAPPHPQGVCCFSLFGIAAKARAREGVDGLPGVHHRLVDAVLQQPGSQRIDVDWSATGLSSAGELDASALVTRLGGLRRPENSADVLVLRVGSDFGWPLLRGMADDARASFCADLGARCARLAPAGAKLLPAIPAQLAKALETKPAPGDKLNPQSSVAEWAASHPELDLPR